MTKVDEQCETCRYWFRVFGDDGVCRRFPPAVVGITDDDRHIEAVTKFPDIAASGWCGEWKDKTGETT